MHAFKFMNAKYVDAFLSCGRVKLGTPKEYRAPDGYTAGRADDEEGVRIFHPGARVFTGQKLRALMPQMGFAGDPPPALIISENARFFFEAEAYILCLSAGLNRLLVRRMKSEFDADACIRISHLDQFARALSEADLRLAIPDPQTKKLFLAKAITYRRYNLSGDFPDREFFTKRPEYRWQKEVRIAWYGQSPHEPFVLEAPEACRFLSPVDLTKWQ